MAQRKTRRSVMTLYREFLEQDRVAEEQALAEMAQEEGLPVSKVRAFFSEIEATSPAIRERAAKEHARQRARNFREWLKRRRRRKK